MVALIACLAALAGYYAWQHSRYDRVAPREATGRALADTGAMTVTVACIWIVNIVGVRWGVVAAEGSAGSTIGVIVGALLGHPLRRAVLRALRLDGGRVL